MLRGSQLAPGGSTDLIIPIQRRESISPIRRSSPNVLRWHVWKELCKHFCAQEESPSGSSTPPPHHPCSPPSLAHLLNHIITLMGRDGLRRGERDESREIRVFKMTFGKMTEILFTFIWSCFLLNHRPEICLHAVFFFF